MTSVVTDRAVTDQPLMWPCEMAQPNDLRAGDIVFNTKSSIRGIVRTNPGDHINNWESDQDVRISHTDISSVSTISSNVLRDWVKIPDKFQTRVEAVTSVAIRWRTGSHSKAATDALAAAESAAECDDDFVSDDETLPWHLLWALLDDHEEAHIDDDEWPDNVALALGVARTIDKKSSPPTFRPSHPQN